MLEAWRKVLKGEGRGNRPNKASSILDAILDNMWEEKELGAGTAQSLPNMMLFYNTSGFVLRGCHENWELTWGDINLKHDEKNQAYLEFNERLTKTRQGGQNKSPRAFAPKIYETNNERCPIRMYNEFASRRPPSMC